MEKLISQSIKDLSPEKSCPFYAPYLETIKRIYSDPEIIKLVSEANGIIMMEGFDTFKYNSDNPNEDDFGIGQDIIGQKRDELLDQSQKLKSDLSVLKGKPLFKLLDNLKKLRSTLSERELDILKMRTSYKASFEERTSLVLRILVLEGIRQGSVIIKEITIPMARVLGVATIGALIGGAGGGIVGAVFGAGVGTIPGALTTAVIGALPALLIKGVPIVVKGMVKFIEEVVRDDNIIRGLPIGLLNPVVLGAIAAPLIIRLLFNYVKTRIFLRIPAPKSQAGINNELMLLISGDKPTKELIEGEDNIKSKITPFNLSSKFISNNRLGYITTNENYYTESESLIRGLKSVGTSLTVKHKRTRHCDYLDLILTIYNIDINCKFILPYSRMRKENVSRSMHSRYNEREDIGIDVWYNIRIKCCDKGTRKLIIDRLNKCRELEKYVTSDWKDNTVLVETGKIKLDYYKLNELLHSSGQRHSDDKRSLFDKGSVRKKNPLFFAIDAGIGITSPNSLLYVALISLND